MVSHKLVCGNPKLGTGWTFSHATKNIVCSRQWGGDFFPSLYIVWMFLLQVKVASQEISLPRLHSRLDSDFPGPCSKSGCMRASLYIDLSLPVPGQEEWEGGGDLPCAMFPGTDGDKLQNTPARLYSRITR